jgi:hypothetical protein
MCQLCRPIKTNGQRYRVLPILILGPGWINQIKVQFNSAKGLKLPTGVPKRSEYKTKAAFVEFVKKSFADGAALIQSKGDKGLDDLWADPFLNRQVRLSEGAWGFMEHSGELRAVGWRLPPLRFGASGVAAEAVTLGQPHPTNPK